MQKLFCSRQRFRDLAGVGPSTLGAFWPATAFAADDRGDFLNDFVSLKSRCELLGNCGNQRDAPICDAGKKNRTLSGVLAGWIVGLLWTIFAVQIFLSIRGVYRQGWFLTVFKFFVGGFIYLVVLCVALAATFFLTLAMP